MNTATKKAKGHRLEKIVREKLIEAFDLDPSDIRIPLSGEAGADIKLSSRAKAKVPLQFECKYWESFGTIYKLYEQAKSHKENLIPVLVIKSNREEPLIILNFDYFLTLITKS